jgi:hypothetical protein
MDGSVKCEIGLDAGDVVSVGMLVVTIPVVSFNPLHKDSKVTMFF